MKHLLNNLSSTEKNSILEQYRGQIKVETQNFKRLLKTKSGDIRPISEGFFEDNFGEPDVDRATRDSLRATGVSGRGRRDSDYGNEPKRENEYVIFKGQEFGPDDIEYASYDDLGDLPRIEDGKLIVTNPAWEL